MNAKTVRFAEVVKRAGQPENYTLWQDPSQDRVFQSAIKNHRVMTVHQSTPASGADYGEVGFQKGEHTELLVFQKSLHRFEGKRIIGIKYELLKAAPPAKKNPERASTRKESKLPSKKMNVIHFQNAGTSVESEEKLPHDFEEELKTVKNQVRKALTALSRDQHVKAYRILEKLIKVPN